MLAVHHFRSLAGSKISTLGSSRALTTCKTWITLWRVGPRYIRPCAKPLVGDQTRQQDLLQGSADDGVAQGLRMEYAAAKSGAQQLDHDVSSGANPKGDGSEGEVSKLDKKRSGGAETAGRIGCSFWLAKKKRFCTNQAKPGYCFCGNHVPEEALGFKRVPCPVDPSQ